MKKVFLLTAVVFLFSHSAEAQSIKGGMILGCNLSQVDGDEVYGFHKFGANVGTMGIVPIGKNFFFSLETLYNQKGSYQRPVNHDSLNGEYKLKLNFLDVPVLFHYIDKNGASAGTGFSWGRLVEFAEWEHGRRVNWADKFGPYKRDDVNWLFDIQFRIVKGLHFNARYAYSLFSLRTRTFLNGETRHQFCNIATFRLIYVFGDKPPKKKKKEPINQTP